MATTVGVDGSTQVSGTFSYTYDGSATAPTDAKSSYAVVATFTSSDGDHKDASGAGALTIQKASSTTTESLRAGRTPIVARRSRLCRESEIVALSAALQSHRALER